MLADDAPAMDAPAFLAAGMSNAAPAFRPQLTLGAQPGAAVLLLEITSRAEGAPTPEPPPPPPVPSIVTSGLVLHLDAGDAASYPGSGTAWTDLSGNGNNGTLTNGPTYSAADGGQIVFDGVNDYIIGTNSASVQITEGTIACWVRCQSELGYVGLIGKNRAWSLVNLNDVLGCFDWGNNVFRSTSINIADNAWRYIAMTFTNTVGTPSNNAIIYVNGSAVLTTTTKHVNNLTEWGLAVAEASMGQNMRGGIAIGHIYNRVLSATEIQQNFDAQRARFGL